MPVTTLPYIDFANTHYIHARFDLASSNIPTLDLAVLDVPAELLNSNAMDVRDRARLQLAKIYGVRKENVALTIGCTGANTSMGALVGKNGDILVETPGYEPMWRTPTLFGAQVRTFERLCIDGRFEIDPERIVAQINTHTKAVWLTNLHNPSGTLLDRQIITTLAAQLDARGVLLYIDEIYLDFVEPIGQGSAVHCGNNVVIASSLTKVYGLGNLRFGWMIGPEPVIDALNTIQMHLNGIPVAPALAYGSIALDDLDRIQHLATAHTKGRAEQLANMLVPERGFRWHPPAGGIVGMLSIDGVEDDMAFVKALVHEAEVILAPGHFFGIDGMFRLSFGAHEPAFSEGLRRLLSFVDTYRG